MVYLIRLLIVGETGVGKTSLLTRFNEGTYAPNQKTTIGVDYKAKEIDIDGDSVKLQIWDTAGQERFRSMTSAFYNKAQGVVLAFDVGQRDTFLALAGWIRDVRRDAPPGCVLILCANKIDLEVEQWKVRREDFELFAKEHDFVVFEASGKTGHNVQELFLELGRQILAKSRADLAEITDETRGESIVLFNLPPSERKKHSKHCCEVM